MMNRLPVRLLIVVGLILGLTSGATCTKQSSIPLKLSHSRALQDIYRLTDTQDVTITPLKGGLSESTLYKIDGNNKHYVVRFIEHRSMDDRKREVNSQGIVSELGCAPMIRAGNFDEGWFIMDYIQPTALTVADRENSKTYTALAKLLQRIHISADLLPSKFVQGKSIVSEIEGLMNKLFDQDKIPSSIDYVLLQSIINSVKQNYPWSLTLTHRDLNPNNIIFSGDDIFVIDFENAAEDDPMYDLATIGIFYLFDPHYEATFLDAYFNRLPTEQEYRYYQKMKQLALLFYGFNFLDRIPQEMIHTAPTTVKPFMEMLQDVSSGAVDIANHDDQLKLAVSLLQEAINQAPVAQ